MNGNFGYRNLIVWQKAMQMTQLVYLVTRKFPIEERYALSDQLRRAVVSVASNIAEGCGRASNKDYAHFLAIARGSLYETMTQLEMAQQLGFIDSIANAESLATEIACMLGSLLKKYGAIVKSKSGVEVQEWNRNHHPSPSHFDSEKRFIRSSTSTSNFDSPHPSTSNFD